MGAQPKRNSGQVQPDQSALHGVAQTNFGLPATVAGWSACVTVCARFRCVFFVCLSAGYSEVQRDQREDEALDVLNEVVEGAQPVGVLALLHVQQAADLGRLQQPNGMESTRIESDYWIAHHV